MAQDSQAAHSQSNDSDFERFLALSPAIARCSESQLRSLSPLALAYLGDAVYELFVRSRLLLPPQRVRTFHRQVVENVRAEQQAQYLDCLKPYLSAAELDLLRRARNATSGRKTRASLQDYRQATALEALLGYLYLTDPQRLFEVLAYLPISVERASSASL